MADIHTPPVASFSCLKPLIHSGARECSNSRWEQLVKLFYQGRDSLHSLSSHVSFIFMFYTPFLLRIVKPLRCQQQLCGYHNPRCVHTCQQHTHISKYLRIDIIEEDTLFISLTVTTPEEIKSRTLHRHSTHTYIPTPSQTLKSVTFISS
jgi:hypothetical protein